MAGMGNDLIREARKRAGLTQRELAERAGTTQSAIARLESGATTPTFDRVVDLLRACGLELEVALVEDDGSDWAQARRLLARTSEDRWRHADDVARAMRSFRRAGGGRPGPDLDLNAIGLLSVLVSHEVRFIVIGGCAALAHGAPFPTEDLDIAPADDPANLARLDDALEELAARDATEVDRSPLEEPDRGPVVGVARHLETSLGRLDVFHRPVGTAGFADLDRDPTDEEVQGVTVRIASLADVIRSKQAANRPKDQRVLPVLRRILAERHRRPDPG